MSLESLINKIPSYAQDVKTNFYNIFNGESKGLSKIQLYGIALTLGYALKHEQLLNAIRNEAKIYLDESHFEAAKSACAVMAMSTTYYRFLDITADKDIASVPPSLQMDVLNSPGIDRIDYEMYLLALSILKGCTYCILFYKDRLTKKGVKRSAILTLAKTTAVLNGIAETLNIEGLRTYEFFVRGESF